MTRLRSYKNELVSLPKKRSVKASEFLEAFRKGSGDVLLMEKFSLKPKQLESVYSTLLKNGLISEYEYKCRENKHPDRNDGSGVVLTPSAVAKLFQSLSQVIAELTVGSGGKLDPAILEALEELSLRELGKKSSQIDEPTVELCPKCHKAKDSSSPDSCLYCGVVFAKIKSGEKYGEVSVRQRDEKL